MVVGIDIWDGVLCNKIFIFGIQDEVICVWYIYQMVLKFDIYAKLFITTLTVIHFLYHTYVSDVDIRN